MTFAVLLLCVGVLPLALVAFLILPARAPSDGGYLVWGAFSVAVAGVCSLLLRAVRPVASTLSNGLDDMRMFRITVMVFFTVFAGLLSLWIVVIGASLGLNFWMRMACALGSFLILLLSLRYVGLPSYWEYFRVHWDDPDWTWGKAAAGMNTEFIGCQRDQQMRPEYYDEDLRWLGRFVRKRLTSASS